MILYINLAKRFINEDIWGILNKLGKYILFSLFEIADKAYLSKSNSFKKSIFAVILSV